MTGAGRIIDARLAAPIDSILKFVIDEPDVTNDLSRSPRIFQNFIERARQLAGALPHFRRSRLQSPLQQMIFIRYIERRQTASRTESTVAVCSDTARILPSTYSAS